MDYKVGEAYYHTGQRCKVVVVEGGIPPLVKDSEGHLWYALTERLIPMSPLLEELL